MPNHIETISNLNQSLLIEGATLNAEDAQSITKNLEAMYKEGDPEVRKGLAELRRNLEPRLAGQVASAAHESWRKLANELDRRMALAYHPETGIAGVSNVVRAGINRLLVAERDYLPGVTARLSTLSPGAQNAIRGGVALIAIPAAVLLAVNIISGILVGGYHFVRHPWRTLRSIGTGGFGLLGNITAGVATIGAAAATFATLRGYLPPSWSAWLPSFMRPAPTAQPTQKQTAEQIKKLEEDRQAQENTTNTALAEARDRLRNPNPLPFARAALQHITTELGLIQTLTGNTLPADRQSFLTTRRTELENARREMQLITRETPAEVLQAVTKVINALDANVANLLNPPTQREVAGVAVRFANNSIFLDGRRLVIEATRFGSPWLPVTLNALRKSGTNLQANATASFVGIPINRTPVFTPEKVAEALNRYKIGGLPYEEDETDANNRPTGVRLKFSLGS